MLVKNIVVDKNIVLKLLTLNDTERIFNAITTNRNHLRKWLPFVDATKDIKDTLAFVKSIVDDVERRQEIFIINFNDNFAGLLGLKDIDYLNRKVELGYWLVEEMTGKGIVRKSVEKIMHFCFNDLGFNRIQIKCGVGNIKSIAIPKSLGYTFEGIERQGEKHPSKYIDLEIYSFLKHESI